MVRFSRVMAVMSRRAFDDQWFGLVEARPVSLPGVPGLRLRERLRAKRTIETVRTHIREVCGTLVIGPRSPTWSPLLLRGRRGPRSGGQRVQVQMPRSGDEVEPERGDPGPHAQDGDLAGRLPEQQVERVVEASGLGG